MVTVAESFRRGGLLLLVTIGLFPTAAAAQASDPDLRTIESFFDKGRGQLQVGGPYAGIEFHHSRALPSRVSFYYPVANSIDLSTDYWQRDESMPFSVTLTVDGKSASVGEDPFPYRSTPSYVVFEKVTDSVGLKMTYRFGETLPLMVFEIVVTNHEAAPVELALRTRLRPTLRTSHAYDFKNPTRTGYADEGVTFRADYDDIAADSATIFIVNAGTLPSSVDQDGSRTGDEDYQDDENRYDAQDRHGVEGHHHARFYYHANLDPGETLEIVQLIGSCRTSEYEALVPRIRAEWREDVARYERRSAKYALKEHPFTIDDSVLSRTERWSRAILAANLHYLDGQIVPMPTPAQYNFFFTHDLLLTDLGAVMFDTARVAHDLRYLARLAYPDSLLPHAYYWRDGRYVTEYAGSDNWNHLWFILLAGSYLKHSGDRAAVELLFPMIRHSMRLMLTNHRNGLMHSERPDWWDIGHVYGARAYLTTLMIRALGSYVYMGLELGHPGDSLRQYFVLADGMREQLITRLWDERAGYLLNMLDSTTVDRHYYSGSLLAAAFDLLDEPRKTRLLESAREVLLDEKIGIRNAMPADFLDHIDLYRFNGAEAGAPYRYLNGGVWPQGNAWYAMAVLAAGRPDSAKALLKRFLTLDGIERSPNGQPALYEYRNADRSAPDYGQIDKTTFLWAGGWYLYVLYQLAGVREDEWNLWFAPRLPGGFENLEYDLLIHGGKTRVTWSGEGRHFREIRVDEERVHSAIAYTRADRITLQRGYPDQPYLARASGIVDDVKYDASSASLIVQLRGLRGQALEAVVVSARPARYVEVDGHRAPEVMSLREEDGAYVSSVSLRMDGPLATVRVGF